MKIKIGHRTVGSECPPFVVAEIGSNWRTFEDCMTSISQAKSCGADAVKFQAFTGSSLYGFGGSLVNELPLDWLPKLKEKADAVGIEFMCSAFSPELVAEVDKYVNIHKVASAECTHVRILERLRSIGKPVFLSTGAHGVDDINKTLAILGDTPTVLLYCVAAYPAQAIELDTIAWMREEFFSYPVGYSDHSTDILTIPVQACHWGQAAVLEKHVSFIEFNTPDSPHSLNGAQFRQMVDRIHSRHKVGQRATKEESGMVMRHNRRLIATKCVAAGDRFIEGENFGIYRSLKDDSHAFSPFFINEVNGKTALREFKAGDGIGPGDV